MKILTDRRQKIQYKSLWRWRGKSYQCLLWTQSFFFSFIERRQIGLSSVSHDPYSEEATAAYGGCRETVQSLTSPIPDQSLDQYRVSPLTPPSETSSTFSPSERRESNDSQDIGRNNSEGRRRREGKDERFARIEGITEFITVDDIINLPMGRFLKSYP